VDRGRHGDQGDRPRSTRRDFGCVHRLQQGGGRQCRRRLHAVGFHKGRLPFPVFSLALSVKPPGRTEAGSTPAASTIPFPPANKVDLETQPLTY
jgi:hypothetical protein